MRWTRGGSGSLLMGCGAAGDAVALMGGMWGETIPSTGFLPKSYPRCLSCFASAGSVLGLDSFPTVS